MAQFVEQVEGKDRISELTLKDIGNNVKVAVSNISDKSLGELFHGASGKLHDFASGIVAHLKEVVPKVATNVLTVFTGREIAENTVEDIGSSAGRFFKGLKDTVVSVKDEMVKNGLIKDKEVEVANEEYDAVEAENEKDDFTLKEAVGRSAMGVLTSGLGTIVAAVGDTYTDGYQDVQQESQLEQEECGSSQPADDFECDY